MAKEITKAENIAYLEKGLYYSGFGIEANKTLNDEISKQTKEFSVPLQMHVAGKEADFRLDFKQSEKQPDIYFFNGYQATLKENPEKTQYFAITKNNGITTREAVNLLEGRAVAKSIKLEDGSRQEIWTQINFQSKKNNGNFERKTYFPSYGFDMSKALSDLPLKTEEGKDLPKWIASSLKKGNAVEVDMEMDGKAQKNTIVANPQFKTIDVFDKSNTRILQSNGNTISVKEQPFIEHPGETVTKDVKPSLKEETGVKRLPRKQKTEAVTENTSKGMRR
ncbi:hypothetical protein [Rhizosphaericola mali]|uniref:DUF3945 domain-containing protein n=1 Tax=Rhizosphaericola mali TaxID=2545455 RepID=A0A5P2GAH1_9BACT|nr:hypothetical protein [Rhizosphaericola mali]QES88551.1 hypothetical protein E0W69_007705 [Rhizosphaericola mali]